MSIETSIFVNVDENEGISCSVDVIVQLALTFLIVAS